MLCFSNGSFIPAECFENDPWTSYDPEPETSFRTTCRKAGIKDFHPHDLRHTCAAWLVQAGVPIMEVRDLLRHTTVQVTEKYAHLAPENVRKAVSMLDKTVVASRLRHVGPPVLRLVKGGK